jgi:predicted HAD superfamily hydrolase
MIYSFDIFDTVLTRRTFRASDIHLLVGRDLIAEGLWHGSAAAWQAARQTAERKARQRTRAEEISLSDIEACLPSDGAAPLARRAVELELQHELAQVAGIGVTLDRLSDLEKQGQAICYTSDMYLPAAQILAMLGAVGAPRAPLFLSCERGASKRSGALFRSVAEQFGVPLSEITHVGDHTGSDYTIPSGLGLKAMLFKDSLPTMLEAQIYERLKGHAPLLASTLAGGMRAARLRTAPECAGHLARLGTQEGAVVHIGFVLWLLGQINQLGPQGIAFLARDGYLSSKVYEVLRSRLAPAAPPGAYTYASRQSLHLASLGSEFTDEDMAWIMAGTEGLTFKEWLFRLGVERSELSLPQHPLLRIPGDAEAFTACKADCQQLLKTPEFLALALAKAREARALACDYLERRIAPAKGSAAIVDIGWNGRMQRSIVQVLAPTESDTTRIHGFYLGILRTPSGSYGNYTAWLFDLRKEVQPYCASHFQLFETLFAAPHGTTYGYRRNAGGDVVPTLAEHDPMTSAWPELGAYHQNILDISANIVTGQDDMVRAEPEIRAICRHAIARMFRAPDRDQAMAFSRFGFSSDQANLSKEKLFYQLTWLQQYRCLVDRRFMISKNHWREGQLALADAPLVRMAYLLRSALRLWIKKEISMMDILRQIKYRVR